MTHQTSLQSLRENFKLSLVYREIDVAHATKNKNYLNKISHEMSTIIELVEDGNINYFEFRDYLINIV